MKTVVCGILMGFLWAPFLFVSSAGDARAEEEALRQYALKVEGMTCPVGCIAKVRETLEGIDGVDQVTVDFDTKTATVTMKAGKSLSQEACREAFRDTPYKVSSFEPTAVSPPSGI